jgi:hypothetical protein
LEFNAVNNITTSSTLGGVITVFPGEFSTIEIRNNIFSVVSFTSTSETYGGFVYIATVPSYVHIFNNNFSLVSV